MALSGDYWEVLFRFYMLKAWRIVEAADATGNKCRCLLLPMDCNGIMLSKNGNMPYMRMLACKMPFRGNDGFFRTLTPTITKEHHEYCVENGYLAPDQKPWAENVGGIRLLGWAKDFKDRPYKQKKLREETGEAAPVKKAKKSGEKKAKKANKE